MLPRTRSNRAGTPPRTLRSGHCPLTTALAARTLPSPTSVPRSTVTFVPIHDPGPIRTGMRAKAFPGEDPATLKTPEDIAPLFVKLADPALAETGKLFRFATDDVV